MLGVEAVTHRILGWRNTKVNNLLNLNGLTLSRFPADTGLDNPEEYQWVAISPSQPVSQRRHNAVRVADSPRICQFDKGCGYPYSPMTQLFTLTQHAILFTLDTPLIRG
jgi:hypothetical protein